MDSSNETPAEKPSESTDNDTDGSVFRMLCKLVGPTAARMIRKHIAECARHDENSYFYKHALLTWAMFRVAANTPVVVSELLQQLSCSIDEAMGRIAATTQKVDSEPASDSTKFLAVANTPPVFRCLEVKPRKTLLQKLERCEAWFAQRVRLTIVALVLMSVVICLIIEHHEKYRADQSIQQEQVRLQSQEDEKLEQIEQLRVQDHNDVEQRFAERLEQHVEAAAMASYPWAYYLEKGAQRVQMSDGKYAWQINLSKKTGLLTWSTDSKNPQANLLVYIEDRSEH